MRLNRNIVKVARFTIVQRGSTTILPFPAPCWCGRPTTRIWSFGCATCSDHNASAKPTAGEPSYEPHPRTLHGGHVREMGASRRNLHLTCKTCDPPSALGRLYA